MFFPLLPSPLPSGSIVASQLYLPNAALESLGLPMLDLPAPSVSLSLERLLTLLGVQKHPSLEVLTGLMTAKGSTDEKREAALMYMLNNIERYKNDYVALLKAGSIPPILPTNKVREQRRRSIETDSF